MHLLNPLARQALLVMSLIMLMTGAVLAKPPPWAPAHGYRAKTGDYGDAMHLPWHSSKRHSDYITDGRCDRDKLGAVIGGIIGGVAGSQVGKGSGKTAATIAGAVIGVIVGKSIGQHMDETDQNCTGQALEYAADKEPVQWHDPDTGGEYRVTPTRTFERTDGRYCREYTTEATIDGKQQQVYGTSCRQADGSWEKI